MTLPPIPTPVRRLYIAKHFTLCPTLHPSPITIIMQHFHATTNEELRHFLTVPPPPSYDAAQASAAHTRGNAHVIAAATRRAAPGESTAEAPDLSPLPQSLNRPRLPEDKRNHILDSLPEDAAIVKFQTIVREEKEITVGRIKLPIPGVCLLYSTSRHVRICAD